MKVLVGSFVNKTLTLPELHLDVLCIDREHPWVIREEYLFITMDQFPTMSVTTRWNGLHPYPIAQSHPVTWKQKYFINQTMNPLCWKGCDCTLFLWFIEDTLLPFRASPWDMTRPHTKLLKSFKWTRTARFAVSLGPKIFIWSFFCPLVVWELWHLDSFNRYPGGRTRKEGLRSPSCLF